MSILPSAAPVGSRRVRHQARESLAVMAVSVGLSVGLVAALTLIATLGG